MQPHDTALLIMDLQPRIIDHAEDKEAFLNNANAVADSARAKGIPVIFVVVGFRSGYPEAPTGGNKVFGHLRERNPDAMVNVETLADRKEGDLLVTKKRVSAFVGSDLDVILRSQGIKRVVLSGIMTSGVVLSTAREAADKDYEITVLSDLCADPDKEVHRVLMEKIFPWQADVMDSKTWIASL